ncbi:MAG: CDP-alcohol phosphatidyltransferase family protein [Thermoplasmatota archaeon]
MKLLKIVRDAFADEADGFGRISKALRPADFFTLLNAITGLLGLVLLTHGRVDDAVKLIALAVVLDGCDGIAARLWGGGPLGPFLDTLADLVSFGLLPAAIVAVVITPQWIGLVMGSMFLVAGMLRLARFEALREKTTRNYHSGMTTTGAAILIGMIIFVGVPDWAIIAATALLAFMMVSRIRTLRLTFWPLVAGAFTLFPMFLSFVVPIPRSIVVACLLTGMFLYTIVGPFAILAWFGPTKHPNEQTERSEES